MMRTSSLSSSGRHLGLTLLEVIIVVFVVLLLLGLCIPFVLEQRQNADRAHCANNLRVLGAAIVKYHDNNGNLLPPSRIADNYAAWPVFTAPYIRTTSPLAEWDLLKHYDEQATTVREAWLPEMFCPTRRRSTRLSETGDVEAQGNHLAGAVGDYACVAGDGRAEFPWRSELANGAMILAEILEKKDDRVVSWRSRTGLASLKRGTSVTLLLGEKHVPLGSYGKAEEGDSCVYNGKYPASSARVAGPGVGLAQSAVAPFNNNFGSNHMGICQFIFADTSLRVFTDNVNEGVLGKMAVRED